MYKLALMVLLMVVGCTESPKLDDRQGVYRNTAIPIYSAAVFDRSRFLAETWTEVATFESPGVAACGGGLLGFSTPYPGTQAGYRLCRSGGMWTGSGRIEFFGQGRFTIAGLDDPFWVLWADADMRTVVIGTPSGRFGFILNRGGFPADRLTAARDILDWNGYDLSRLVLLQ